MKQRVIKVDKFSFFEAVAICQSQVQVSSLFTIAVVVTKVYFLLD